jgi:FMN-dependent NADH-azoreductase
MSKVLYIKANAKPEGTSRTFKVSDAFIETYKKNHPNDDVIVLDLYKEDLKPLTEDDLGAIFGPKNDESKSHPVLKYAYQFAEADKYILAAPLWNLSVPGIVKLYFDYVSVVGITFKYVSGGGVAGLLEGKKAMHIVTRGGEYSAPPLSEYEMGDKFVRVILGLFGVYDVSTIAVEKLDRTGVDVEALVANGIKEAQEKAKNF